MENDIKRIEIITDSVYQKKLVELIDLTGVSGYTVLRDVAGKGLQGHKDGHGIAGGYKNCMIIVYCSVEEAHKVVDSIKNLILTYGGVCVVSDAHWVLHN